MKKNIFLARQIQTKRQELESAMTMICAIGPVAIESILGGGVKSIKRACYNVSKTSDFIALAYSAEHDDSVDIVKNIDYNAIAKLAVAIQAVEGPSGIL